MRLGDIANIRSGLVLTRKKAKIKYEVKKEYKLITLKNIGELGFINDEPLETFASNDVLESDYFTRAGDILFRLSYPYTAVSIEEDKTGLLVPSTFAIIRPKGKKYLPEYLGWYLNSDQIKKEVTKSQAGTIMATTNKAVLSMLKIKKLPLQDQKIIGKIYELHCREIRLLISLINEKEKYFKAITFELINKNKGE